MLGWSRRTAWRRRRFGRSRSLPAVAAVGRFGVVSPKLACRLASGGGRQHRSDGGGDQNEGQQKFAHPRILHRQGRVRTTPGRSFSGESPVHTGLPLTKTRWMPRGRSRGCSNVERSMIVAGSNSIKSAFFPTAMVPRSASFNRAAGIDVIFLIASGSDSHLSSRTNLPSTLGKVPAPRGWLVLMPPSLAIIAHGC